MQKDDVWIVNFKALLNKTRLLKGVILAII